MAAPLDFVDTPVTIRYAETDQAGVVYHAHYLVWFEVGRAAWCQSRGVPYAEMESRDGRLLLVAEASCRYKAPARYGEDVIVRTSLAKSSDRILRFRYEVRTKLGGDLLATGQTAHVVADRSFRPARLPEHYRERFGLRPKA